MTPPERLYFLKLGGSLITDKHTARSARRDIIQNLAGEIAAGLKRNPGLRLLVGHGSGSFGHTSAAKYGTRAGVRTEEDWRGFIEVWRDARALNQIVIELFTEAELPVIVIPPSATISTDDGKIIKYEVESINNALRNNLLPVIHGDVVFDKTRGGTVLSTEEIFIYLANALQPQKILLAGQEPGVWADFPECSSLVSMITPTSLAEIEGKLRGSAAVDVTGGMYHKVTSMLELVQNVNELEVLIFSGEARGTLSAALDGEEAGTLLCNRKIEPLVAHES
ncbi:MAG: isopentenyl phosphate kinase [Anaerolineaceae bacterium]